MKRGNFIKSLAIIILLSYSLVGCIGVGSSKDGVMVKFDYRLYNLTKSGTGMVTYVWHDGDIIKSWYDDMADITDSLIDVRKKQGKSYLKAICDFEKKFKK